MTDFFCVEENISDSLGGSYMLNPEETVYNLNLDSVENDVDDDEEDPDEESESSNSKD
jgi:hypothetical protein